MHQEFFATDGFLNQIDEWVEQRIATGCRTFGDLVRRLPGVYPSSAAEALQRLASRCAGRLPEVISLAAQARKPARTGIASLAADGLPVPHPLDFDWRFTDEAIASLVSEAGHLSRHRGMLGIVGAPSVALRASRVAGTRDIIVYDNNQLVLAALWRSRAKITGCHCDILCDVPSPACLDVVITDPPWYLDELCSALRFCQSVCRVGGFVLASIPPFGTRPGIQTEREQFLRYAASLGFELVRIESAHLPYRSPPFEQNALRAAGILGAPVDWRRGDLAVFAKAKAPRPSHSPAPPSQYAPWSEVSFSTTRVRIRPGRDLGFSDPRLIRLVDGDVLPTVSRRDQRRANAMVWTSGNRVFACQGGGLLISIAKAFATGRSPQVEVESHIGRRLSLVESRLTRTAAEQIENVLMSESAELRTYAGEGGRSTTRVFVT